jgi:MFS family permease
MAATSVARPAQPQQERERRPFGARFVTAAAFGSVLNPVNSSIIAVALVSIGRAFGAGPDRTAWLVSALYLATAIGQPVMGRLADSVGPRTIYLTGAVMVGLGGLLGYAATGFGELIAARVVIGFGTSAAYPAAMALVRRQSQRLHRETPGSVLGLLAVTGQVSMAVGPPLGGLLIAAGGWRATFLVNVPLAVAALIAAGCWLPADDPRPGPVRVDLAGVLLFAAALTGLLVFLMDLPDPKWWLLAVTAALIAVLARKELRTDSPFIDVRLLAVNRALTVTYLRFGVTMLITYCFIYGWTEWLEQAAGRSPAQAGLLMMPSFVVAAAVSALAARARNVRPPLIAGAAALTAGSLALCVLHARSPLWLMITVSVVFGLQNGLNVVSNQTAMYGQAPAGATGAAAGLLRTSMYLGAIASASLIGVCFGRQASDAGLHRLALILAVASVVLLFSTIAGRKPLVRR